jgi:hypothetical protein
VLLVLTSLLVACTRQPAALLTTMLLLHHHGHAFNDEKKGKRAKYLLMQVEVITDVRDA